ncbi:carcinoembryonic antigen-related cell adhesion molecule 3-like, partial [Sigmodon hispidus]
AEKEIDSRVRTAMQKMLRHLCLVPSFLTFWHLPTTAVLTTDTVPLIASEGDNVLFLVQDLPENIVTLAWFKGNITFVPQCVRDVLIPLEVVAEGRSVLLLIRNVPENALFFSWYKGKSNSMNLLAIKNIRDRKPTLWGPAYSGREIVHSDGSLLLHAVTEKDHGLYSLLIQKLNMEIIETQVELQVDSRERASHSPFCNPPTSSQLMIQAVPWYPAEGQEVLLQVHNIPEDLQEFFWYKSKDRTKGDKFVQYLRAKNSFSWGPSQRIRGRVYENASLLLQDIIEDDAGMYTVEVVNKDSNIEKANVEFYVNKSLSQPFVQIIDTTVTGGTSVIFTCITPDSNTFIHWIFNNQILQLSRRLTLSPTQCGLRIDPISSEDAGTYQCVVSNGFSSKTSLPVSWP